MTRWQWFRELIKDFSIGLAIFCLIVAMMVMRAASNDMQKEWPIDGSPTRVYKTIKVLGRTYNVFVVEIDGDEYVVCATENSISMVKKEKTNGPLPRSSNRDILPKGDAGGLPRGRAPDVGKEPR